MNTRLIGIGTLGGAMAVWMVGAVAVHSQEEFPLAPYEEVKPWGPSVPGSFDWEPGGADADRNGHVYFLRRTDPAVWVVKTSGEVVRSFGQSLFVWAHGLYVDTEGNIWATDCAVGPSAGSQPELQTKNEAAIAAGRGHQVYKFSSEGELLLTLGKAGDPGTGLDQFYCPSDVVTGPDGSIYVSDGHEGEYPNGRVLKFTAEGEFLKTWGSQGSEPEQFRSPHTLAFDSQGRLFVGDRSNGRIAIYDQEGNLLDTYRAFGGASGITITPDDTLYVCCPGRTVRIGSAKTGEVTGYIPDVWGEGLAVDNEGSVYVGEVFNHVWRKFRRTE